MTNDKQPPTIALLSNRFPPILDGVGDYTARLAAALARCGAEVHVICREQSDTEHWPGVTAHPVLAEWGPRATVPVLDVLERIRADWVLLQYVPYSFHSLGIPLALPRLLRAVRSAGMRTGVMFHEVHIRPQGIKGRIISGLQRHIARQLCAGSEVVLTSIPFYRHLLQPFCADVQVLPIGSNIEIEPLPEAERQRLRRQLFPDKSVVVATFGRRDMSALTAAVEILEHVGFLAIGGGQPTFLVSKTWKVYATGHLPAAAVGVLLQCADLFVLPDPVTPFGAGGTSLKSGSLAAALAAGLPVIGVRGDMTEPPLRHGENIWLVDRPDAECLRAAIQLLLDDPDLRERLRQNGHALYHERLTWPVIAAAYRDVLWKKDKQNTGRFRRPRTLPTSRPF